MMSEVTIDFPILGILTSAKAVFVTEYTKDFSARRAAEVLGYDPQWGYALLKDDDVKRAIANVVAYRQANSNIDAQWVLDEAVDNHRIARQHGNLAASNAALNLVSKHKSVDALASAQINVNVTLDEDIMNRIKQGRKRALQRDQVIDVEPLTPAKPTEAVSFI